MVSGCGSTDPNFSNDCSVRVWNLKTYKPVILEGHTNTVLCVCISPDNTIVASGGHDRTIRVWDILKG